MVMFDGGKIELIAQIYDLCILINFWYEHIWSKNSVQFSSRYLIKLFHQHPVRVRKFCF